VNPGRPAFLANRATGWKLTSTAILLAASLSLQSSAVTAAPGLEPHSLETAAQNVDYISAGAGSALDMGFPVLVPSWVPGPFGGEPSIDAGGGSYSLYWMTGGGEPTFLQVSGVVGGGLPAGSPYDLNIELSINASVNGYGAIHDVTPIYDTVWWIQGGVLYTVTSRNMTGTDSLSLANSLITFVPPAAQEPEPEPTTPPDQEPEPTPPPAQEPGDSGTGTSDPGSGAGTGNSGTDPGVDDSGAGTSQEPAGDEESANQDGEASDAGQGDESSTAGVTPQQSGSDGTGIPVVTSDGTGGPPVEVVQSDGTGGGDDVIVVPRKLPELAPTP